MLRILCAACACPLAPTLGCARMSSRISKADRMELRRETGSRALPDPIGPQPRAKGPRYLIAHACFKCRLSFKRAARNDGTAPQCPECAGPMAEMGRGFKAPLRRNVDGWKAAQLLHHAGFRFPSTSRREDPSLPTKSREVAAFVEQNRSHPYRTRAT